MDTSCSFLHGSLTIATGIVLSKLFLHIFHIASSYLTNRYERYLLMKNSLNLLEIASTQLGETSWFPWIKGSLKFANALGFPIFIASDLAFRLGGKSEDPVEIIMNTVKIILEQNGISSQPIPNSTSKGTNNKKNKKRVTPKREEVEEESSNSLLGGIDIGQIVKQVTSTLMKEE